MKMKVEFGISEPRFGVGQLGVVVRCTDSDTGVVSLHEFPATKADASVFRDLADRLDPEPYEAFLGDPRIIAETDDYIDIEMDTILEPKPASDT